MGRILEGGSVSANVSGGNFFSPSGTFGTGQYKFFTANSNFIVPTSITSVRVRVWGAGGESYSANGGGGGGFSMKTITGLTPGSTIAVTVGTTAGATSSFGTYCSATGGGNQAGGSGSGGEINNSGGNGGNGNYASAGGAGNYFGRGGDGVEYASYGRPGKSGASGGGVEHQTSLEHQAGMADLVLAVLAGGVE